MIKNPIVLLHGLFGAPLGLEEIAEDLRKAGYEVFVPAVPPFAGTEKAWNSLTEADVSRRYAEYFKAYFEENAIVRPILVGHSMGTLVASAILAHFPELIDERVVFLSPVSQRPNVLIGKVSILSAYLPQRFSDWVTTRYLAVERRPILLHRILKKVHKCSLDHRPKRKNIIQAVQFSEGTTVMDELETLNAEFPGKFKVKMVAGESDNLISRHNTEKLAKKMQQTGKFEVECSFLTDTGHLHNYEKPHETVGAILDFLTV